ncbi:similar to An01g01670 [Aspergillus niger]|uniref:Similar to An01g01670 n=1 Tax=Aspergillus niger TaxID=5061 RepID=A0A117E430_ASPNG|nr:similar to An01g01670 [Aspergillus niger]
MNNLVRSYSHIHLETLPAEIRIQILLLLNVEGLKSLVQASPVYHNQYLLDRKRLLLNCLATTLGRIFFEACIVQETSSVSFSQTRNHDRIHEYFGSLMKRRCHSDLTAGLTLKDAIDMVTFYLSVLKPFAQHYSVWALGNLAQEPEATHTKIDEALSESEEHRIIRALYRFQLCSNVFGVGPNKDELDLFRIDFQFSDSDILKLLEDLWEPWELEEINCINVFAETKCRAIHDAVTWDFSERNPRFDDQERPPTPDGAVNIPQHSHAYLIGTITQGLERLHTIFFKVQEHSDLVNVMEQTLVLWLEEFLEGDVHGAFTHAAQSGRRARAPSEQDEKEERREPLPFRGDRVDDYYSDGAYPPLAWTLLWKGTYSNMLGSYIPDEFHRWGYVMWDAARLERTGAKEVLARGWELMWGEDEDARDQRDFF